MYRQQRERERERERESLFVSRLAESDWTGAELR